MKVLELLDEIEEIVDTAPGFPMTGKIMIEADELLEIVKEIRVELPDEIEQAKWIKDERQRILDEAKAEYESILKEAKDKAEVLVEQDEITVKAKKRADEIMRVADTNARSLKMGTFEYVDHILYNFQDKMDQMNAAYFNDMFHHIQTTFDSINTTISQNRSEIKDLIYQAQLDSEK
ncbi:MAG: ATPase [Firmicutes bacterium]|nr:ATPase [Bacillota bacterium]